MYSMGKACWILLCLLKVSSPIRAHLLLLDHFVCANALFGAFTRHDTDLEALFRDTQDGTRAAQLARVEARYYVVRGKCWAVGGAKRDGFLIAARAARGSALLELAAGYENRS